MKFLLAGKKDDDVHCIVFSSFATVYYEENDAPYVKTMKKGKYFNPYGWSKYII